MSQPQPRPQGHPLAARLGFAPGPVLRICGMRRSGNHAITDWLQRNSPTGGSVFFNNCQPGKGPLAHFRGLEVNGERVASKPAFRNLPDSLAAAGEGAMVLISYEDALPSLLGQPLSGPFDESLFTGEVVIYRGFLNWSASLLKKLQGNPAYSPSRRVSILLRACDIYTGMLELVLHQDDLGVTAICYDDWYSSEPYRANTLSRLGLPLRDNSLGPVQPYGGGSSFQKEAASSEALETDRRWQLMADDPEYQAVLHVAARDALLTDRLSRLMPKDAACLERVARHSPLPGGALS